MEVENEFRQQVELFRKQDEERHIVLQNLVKALHEAKKDCVRLQHDVESEGDSRRKYQTSNDELKAELQRLKDRVREASYTLVLIDADADGYVFADTYLQNGLGGGSSAAKDLQAAIKSKLAELGLKIDHHPVLVRAFANTAGLYRTFARAGLSTASVNLDSFIQDFNNVKHCEFVAIGSGKDKADEKIKVLIRRALKDPTCAQLVLGVCHDNGYVRLLEQVREQEELSRITLLKSFETGREYTALELKDIVVDGLFRKETLRPSGPQAANTATTLPLHSSGASMSYAKQDTASYASTLANGNVSEVQTPSNVEGGIKRFFTLRLDPAQHRVDERLPPVDVQAKMAYKQKLKDGTRFCNDHFLAAACPFVPPKRCQYKHEGLTDLEVLVMANDKRLGKCALGPACKKPICFYRHV